MGGEKREEKQAGNNWEGSPPHGRGKAAFVVRFNSSHRITPAWAGKSSNRKSVEAMARDHPRMGGEKVVVLNLVRFYPGSPPHGRGKAHELRTLPRAIRITPAWAGKRHKAVLSSGRNGDHPRMGGEKQMFTMDLHGARGSPPHGRGKVYGCCDGVEMMRITPAWAGKRLVTDTGRWSARDHPRMGGEKRSGMKL